MAPIGIGCAASAENLPDDAGGRGGGTDRRYARHIRASGR